MFSVVDIWQWSGQRRSALAVLEDLRDVANEPRELNARSLALNAQDPLSAMGLFDKTARAQFLRHERVVMSLPITLATIALLMGIVPLGGAVPVLLGAFGVAVLIRGIRRRSAQCRFQRSIEFHLPMVMERLVMAVQAGLDILPAVRVVLRFDSSRADGDLPGDLNPPELLLSWAYRLTNAGLSFEQSLQQVASAVASSALRHAFIHLGVAHREGGELTTPLRELSDSTQLYYQESAEEEIAKLPVKATVPLLFTFAGLIITFLAPPIVQLLEFSVKTGGAQ